MNCIHRWLSVRCDLTALLAAIQQFGAHLMDSHLIQADSNLAALNGESLRSTVMTAPKNGFIVLEGEYVTPQDAKDISQRPPFYAAVYAIASLYLGLLFRAPDAALRERVKLLRDNQQGGTGTIVRTFSHILLSVTSLVLDDATDVSSLESTYRWLNALPHSKLLIRNLRLVSQVLLPQMKTFALSFAC